MNSSNELTPLFGPAVLVMAAPAIFGVGCASSAPSLSKPMPEVSAQSGTLTELRIEVVGLEPNVGEINLEVIDDAENWKKSTRPVAALRARVTGSTMRFVFRDVPAGTIAIRLFQDANGNGTLDTNALGIPNEGYGFSGQSGLMGPPSFEQASFQVPATGATASVRVQ